MHKQDECLGCLARERLLTDLQEKLKAAEKGRDEAVIEARRRFELHDSMFDRMSAAQDMADHRAKIMVEAIARAEAAEKREGELRETIQKAVDWLGARGNERFENAIGAMLLDALAKSKPVEVRSVRESAQAMGLDVKAIESQERLDAITGKRIDDEKEGGK